MIEFPKIDALTTFGFLLLVQVLTAMTIAFGKGIARGLKKDGLFTDWFPVIAMTICLAWSLAVTAANVYATGGGPVDFMNTAVIGLFVMLLVTGTYNVYKNLGLKSIVDGLIEVVLSMFRRPGQST